MKYFAGRILIICSLIPSLSSYGDAQRRIDSRTSKETVAEPGVIQTLEKTIPRLMKEGEVPGLSMVLLRNSKIYWYRGFGVKNAETNAPVKEKTVFETASLTKPVLAYAALKLVDQGKLNLDTPLSKYLPENYLPADQRAALVTAGMVLSHTTGFQNELHPGEPLQIHFTPGERFSYSGEGFIFLQKVIEHITRQRFDIFMKKTVFDPLAMKSASYQWRSEYEAEMANGHNAAGIVAERIKPTEIKMSWLHMTALDYARFVVAVLNRVGLKPSTARLMLTPQSHIDESCVFCLKPGEGRISPSLSWGLGWGLEHTTNGDAFWHWGENRGEFQSFAMAYPEQKTGIVVFTNSGNGLSIMPAIVSAAIGGDHPAFVWMGYDLYNSPGKIAFRARNLRTKMLFKEILLNGTTAINDYRRNHQDWSGPGVLDESQTNTLGYWLKGKKRLKEAIEVFKINTERFSNSWNAFDSLGEAYMDNGDKERAIEAYQKSVQLNPANTNAVEMIKRLRNP